MRFAATIAFALSFASIAFSQGKTGVLAIDTLPIYDWDIKTDNNSLVLTLASALVFPGGGQFYTGHKVRGGFLFAFETALIYEVYFNKRRQRKEFNETIGMYRDSISYYQAWLDWSANLPDTVLIFPPPDTLKWQANKKSNEKLLSNEVSKKKASNDLWNSEIAWLAGLHIYGLFDAYGIWKNNNGHNTETHAVSSAIWRAALIPGWGQIYNHEYGKAGLLYMGLFGSAVSYNSRQKMVEYHLQRRRAAMKDEDAQDVSMATEDILFFRKKRNQYVWAMTLFYIYSIADAGVDAMLHNFDSPAYFVMNPMLEKGINIEAGFRF